MKKKKKADPIFPTRAADGPVTQKMLYGVRDELKSGQLAVQLKLEGAIQELRAEVHRIGILVEEQNARNKIVLDGLTFLMDQRRRHESI